MTSADEARQLLDPMAESFQGIDGLQHGFEYRDDAVVETLSIDYSTADVEKIAELPGSDFSGNLESGKVSLKESLKAFEGQGYTRFEGEEATHRARAFLGGGWLNLRDSTAHLCL